MRDRDVSQTGRGHQRKENAAFVASMEDMPETYARQYDATPRVVWRNCTYTSHDRDQASPDSNDEPSPTCVNSSRGKGKSG